MWKFDTYIRNLKEFEIYSHFDSLLVKQVFLEIL
jgi:hypothetical protein